MSLINSESILRNSFYTGKEDIENLYINLVRGQNHIYICSIIDRIFSHGDFQSVRDIIILAFHIRNIRGGRGEKRLFYIMLKRILEHRPELSYQLLKLVPIYGCWKDLWYMYTYLTPFYRVSIDYIVKNQFFLDQESEHPSLLAKWLPRENSRYNSLAKHFARLLFPLTAADRKMRVYRKTVAYLNSLIHTTEIKMCGRVWKDIDPTKVPFSLFHKNKLAFLNMEIGVRGSIQTRYPKNKDRLECAEHFKIFLGNNKNPYRQDEIHDGDKSLRDILDETQYDHVRNAIDFLMV